MRFVREECQKGIDKSNIAISDEALAIQFGVSIETIKKGKFTTTIGHLMKHNWFPTEWNHLGEIFDWKEDTRIEITWKFGHWTIKQL